MRLRITNASKAPDSRILPLIRFAARFFNVSGTVRVNFRETKKVTKTWRTDPRENEDGKRRDLIPAQQRQKLLSGFCNYIRGNISVCSTLNPAHPQLPLVTESLRYFSSDRIPVKPYTLTTPDEIILHVAAHEFAHLMKRGHKFRKSRIEVFCENRATEVLEAFRSPDGQAWIAEERARIEGEPLTVELRETDTAEVVGEKIAAALDEDPKRAKRADELSRCIARRKNWESKARRAANALRKLNRKIKRLEKLTK